MIIVVMGVSGTGKSTLGKYLARTLGWDFIEGDDFHPSRNVDKMRNGTPLTDQDRIPWLDALHHKITNYDQHAENAILVCSALKADYRERLSRGISDISFVYLRGDADLVQQRMRKRKGHFMPVDLLNSQFETLEPPESAILIPIDIPTRQQAMLVHRALHNKLPS